MLSGMSAIHTFASVLQVGEHDVTKPEELRTSDSLAVASQVSNVTTTWLTGVFDPLTRGTIVVDQVVASCYAVVDNQTLRMLHCFLCELWIAWSLVCLQKVQGICRVTSMYFSTLSGS